MGKHVNVVEIGPRDGFQSISCMMIPTEVKLEIIEAILAAGVKTLQCTSFVSPKAIPQMQDAAKIAAYMLEKHPDIETFALVPNFQGAKLAAEAGLKKVAPVISLSASHNMNNVRRTHQGPLMNSSALWTPSRSWSWIWMWPPPLAAPLKGA